MKQCTKCGQVKPEAEFYKGRGACKDCARKRSKDTYAPRKAAVQEKRQRVYVDGLKRCKSCEEFKPTSEYTANPTHWDRLSHICKSCGNKQARQSYVAVAQERRDNNRKAYQKSRQSRLAKARAWRKNNPDASRAIWHRYKGRKLNAGGSFTTAQWEQLRDFYTPDGECLCCGQSCALTMDHVIPLFNGGSNGIENIQPLCQSCNSTKGDERSTDYRPDQGAFARGLSDESLHQPTSRAGSG